MFLYIKTNILRGYGIFKNDFAHSHEPANAGLVRNQDLNAMKVILHSLRYNT